jgi:hypothetical protein
MEESGPVYLLPTGPASSFLVVSDPEAAKHVLRASDNPARPVYDKGLVAEVRALVLFCVIIIELRRWTLLISFIYYLKDILRPFFIRFIALLLVYS